MFGHKSEPSRFYAYGASRPVEGLDDAERQMTLRHQYRNKLVELELQRRAEAEAAVRALAPGLDAQEAGVAAIVAELEAELAAGRAANAAARRKVRDPARAARVAEIRVLLRAARLAFRDARRAAYEALDSVALEAAAHERHVAARAEAVAGGLYWGCYLSVEQAMSKCRSGAPPRFRRRQPGGMISVQLQGGLTADEAFGCADQRFRLAPGARRQHHPSCPPVSGSRRQQRPFFMVWLRVGSVGRKPVWCVAPVGLHRPWPAGAVLKWAHLVRSRVGTHDKWQLLLVFARGEGWARPRSETGAVGIDLGWRLLPCGGLRVAYWHDDAGRNGELRIPADVVSCWRHADELRSLRDRLFNEARADLLAWLAANQALVPAWLTEQSDTLSQWRSQARLAALVIRWRGNRFPGDDAIFARLEGRLDAGPPRHYDGWRLQDKHLYDWECAERRGAIAWRNNAYREFSAWVRATYRDCFVEDTNWASLARRPAPDADAVVNVTARYHQRVAAVGTLARHLREAVAGYVSVPTNHTTQECHLCSWTAPVDAASNVIVACGGCGQPWDQDSRAAQNHLARGLALAGASAPLA